jgi:hypothetical protein
MSEDYRLFVNDEKTVLVRIWGEGTPTVLAEVATREHPDAIWGPPVVVKEER